MPSLRPNRNVGRTSMPALPISDEDLMFEEPERKRRRTMLDSWVEPSFEEADDFQPRGNGGVVFDPLLPQGRPASVKLKFKLGGQADKRSGSSRDSLAPTERTSVDTPEATPPGEPLAPVGTWNEMISAPNQQSNGERDEDEYIPNGVNGTARHTSGVMSSVRGSGSALTPRQSRKGSPFLSTPNSAHTFGTSKTSTSSVMASGYTPKFSRQKWEEILEQVNMSAINKDQPGIAEVLRILSREYSQDPYAAEILDQVMSAQSSEAQYREFKGMYKRAKKHLKRIQRSARRMAENLHETHASNTDANGTGRASTQHDPLPPTLENTSKPPSPHQTSLHSSQKQHTRTSLSLQASPAFLTSNNQPISSQHSSDEMDLRSGKRINQNLPNGRSAASSGTTTKATASRSRAASKSKTANKSSNVQNASEPSDSVINTKHTSTAKGKGAASRAASTAGPSTSSAVTNTRSSRSLRNQTVPQTSSLRSTQMDDTEAAEAADAEFTKIHPSIEDDDALSEVNEDVIHRTEEDELEKARKATPNPPGGRWQEEPPVFRRNYRGGHRGGGRAPSIDFFNHIPPKPDKPSPTPEQKAIQQNYEQALVSNIREQSRYIAEQQGIDFDDNENVEIREPLRPSTKDATPLRETGGALTAGEPKKKHFHFLYESDNDDDEEQDMDDQPKITAGRTTRASAAAKAANPVSKAKDVGNRAPISTISTIVPSQEPLLKGQWTTACDVCHEETQDLIRCCNCPRAYHLDCMDEPYQAGLTKHLLVNEWYCQYCRNDAPLPQDDEDSDEEEDEALMGGFLGAAFSKLKKVKKEVPFSLPKDIQNYFEGVSAAKGGRTGPAKGVYVFEPHPKAGRQRGKPTDDNNEADASAPEDDDKPKVFKCDQCGEDDAGGTREIVFCAFPKCTKRLHRDHGKGKELYEKLNGRQTVDLYCTRHDEKNPEYIERKNNLVEDAAGVITLSHTMRKVKDAKVMSDADARRLNYTNRGNVVIDVVPIKEHNVSEAEEEQLHSGHVMRLTSDQIESAFIKKIRRQQRARYVQQQVDRQIARGADVQLNFFRDEEIERRVQAEVENRMAELRKVYDAAVARFMSTSRDEQAATQALASMKDHVDPPAESSPELSSAASSPEPPTPPRKNSRSTSALSSSRPALSRPSSSHPSSSRPPSRAGPSTTTTGKRKANAPATASVAAPSSLQGAGAATVGASRKRKATEPLAEPIEQRPTKITVVMKGLKGPEKKVAASAGSKPSSTRATPAPPVSRKRKAADPNAIDEPIEPAEPKPKAKRVKSGAESADEAGKLKNPRVVSAAKSVMPRSAPGSRTTSPAVGRANRRSRRN